MKSKLLNRKSYGLNTSRETVDEKRGNIQGSSAPRKGNEIPHEGVNPAVDAQARKGLPGLLKATTRFPNQRYF
jgi:hypothetical protein